MASRRRSRSIKKEEAKNLRRALLFGCLTILVSLGVLFLGIPLLIKTAAFLGELKSSSQIIETGDTLPPAPPIIQALPNTTNEPKVKAEGTSEANSRVFIFLNGHLIKEAVSDQNGYFTAEVALSGKRNELTFQAEDQTGNRSQESPKTVVFFDDEPPLLEISSPLETTITATEKQITIEGKTEKETTVLINERLVILNQEGQFSHPYSLSEGQNIIKIVVEDKAGNQTEKELQINYQPF